MASPWVADEGTASSMEGRCKYTTVKTGIFTKQKQALQTWTDSFVRPKQWKVDINSVHGIVRDDIGQVHLQQQPGDYEYVHIN
jgi:hypothetical protein